MKNQRKAEESTFINVDISTNCVLARKSELPGYITGIKNGAYNFK